jgi:hypothetical protein
LLVQQKEFEMIDDGTRTSKRRPCRGDVLIHNFAGSSTSRGQVTELNSGGARVLVDHPIATGEVVRLTFPRRPGHADPGGRMIIGRVAHSTKEAGHHIIGFTFGWDTDLQQSSASKCPKKKSVRWFDLFRSKARPRRPALSRG